MKLKNLAYESWRRRCSQGVNIKKFINKKFMKQNLKKKSTQIVGLTAGAPFVGFAIGALLIVFLSLSLIIKGKEVIDILDKNYYPSNIISVNGEGKINVMPDVAYLGYDVETKDKDVKAAMEKNKETTKKFLSFLFEQGITQDNVWVLNSNMWKNTEYGAEGEEITTYQITETIKVKIKENLAEKIKIISDRAIENGMTPNLGCCGCGNDSEESRTGLYADSPEKYNVELISKALKDARRQAREQTGLAGLRLGEIVGVADYSQYPAFSTSCGVFADVGFLNKIEVKKNISVIFEVKR